jgi:hypothetical protein
LLKKKLESGAREFYTDVRFDEISLGVLFMSALAGNPACGLGIRFEVGVDSGGTRDWFQNSVHRWLKVPEFLIAPYVRPYASIGAELPLEEKRYVLSWTIFTPAYYSCDSLTNVQRALVKVAVLCFDKLVIPIRSARAE